MKNRTVIGIVCLVVALVVTFVVAPLVNKLADNRTEIVRITNDVTQGHVISSNDIEKVSVGSYNLPDNVIKDENEVIGKYASADLKKGEYVLASMVTTEADNASDVFKTLDGTKQAISITIQSFAGGLSGKLQNGDIVSLLVYENDTGNALLPVELTYVKVITTTTAEGTDKDELTVNEDGTYDLPTTLTVLASPSQAKLLVEYENSGKIHAELVYRGDAETAQKFLDVQDEYLEKISETADKNSGTVNENTGNTDSFDIVKYANDIINGNVPVNKEAVSDE